MKVKRISGISFLGSMFMIVFCLSAASQDVKDFDGNVYKVAKIGPQVWTASNLNVSHFRNGDVIPEAKTPEEWLSAAQSSQPAWCYYENDPVNGGKYGKLYNWYAINDPRGLAPDGWHIPQNADWRALVKNLLGVDIAGSSLKSKTEWKSKKGTDKIGFAAIPSGCRDHEGKFRDLGVIAQWWSNSVPVSVKPSNMIYSLMLSDNSIEVKYIPLQKGAGVSVRCEKD